MKKDPQSISKNLAHWCKIYGTATIGSKGQIVIPKEVRDILKLTEGDQLLVLLKDDQAIGLIKASDLQEMYKSLQQEIESMLPDRSKPKKTLVSKKPSKNR